ncbi:MAG: hypothetical protein R3Y63_11530 [Eubacteriales bacterium]
MIHKIPKMGNQNGLLEGARAANMQTANYMTDCCMEEDVIRDVVSDIDDCIDFILTGEVREIQSGGMYANGVNSAYVENYIMAFCEAKRHHLELLQQELIPMDFIKLIVAKGAPKDCRSEFLSIIMTKSWKDIAPEFVRIVGDQEDFPQMLQAHAAFL